MVKISHRPIRDVMLDLKDYAKKGVKFMVIGAVGSVVNLGVLYILVQYFKLYYIWAEVIAILVAFAVNYNGNILVKNINVTKNAAKEIPPSPGILNAQKSEDLPAKPGD
jgi:GtrA-like protein